jgi:hypothetical protein
MRIPSLILYPIGNQDTSCIHIFTLYSILGKIYVYYALI